MSTLSRFALIPARGGSQRVPRKNIREFLGVPALARVVKTLHESGAVEEVVVSTDDDEIASVARKAGALVPFKRPARLADAYTGARPVIQHALQALGAPDSAIVGVFYPTAVLMTPIDVQASAELLTSMEVEFVLAVTEYSAPVERALLLREGNLVTPRHVDHVGSRSQDLGRSYHDIGQFYWGRSASWRTGVPVVQARSRAYVIESWRAVDIDTPEDWVRAEIAYRMMNA